MKTRNRKRKRKDSEEEKLWFLMKDDNYGEERQRNIWKSIYLPEL